MIRPRRATLARPPLFALAAALTLAAASPSARAAGAIETVSPEIVRQLADVPAGSLVVAGPLVSDVPLAGGHGDDLAVRVANLVAGRFGGTTRAHGQTASLSVARAASAKAAGLVYLTVELRRGALRVTADVYPVMANAWDRVRAPAPPPRAHAFTQAPLDAEVRGFLPPILLEQASVHKAALDVPDVLAVACGESEPGGGLEIALASRTRVLLGHVQHARFVARRAVAWSEVATRVPVALREPLAGAAFAQGALRVGTTDRGGVSLDEDLGLVAPLRGIPVPSAGLDTCADVEPAADAFVGSISSCSPIVRDRVARAEVPTPRYDAAALADVVDARGHARRVLAVREPSSKLHILVDRDARTLDGVGAQVAVGDLDLDGVPEVAVSADGPEDAISVYSADGASEPRLRLKVPAPAGVRALAVCPPEVHGAPALVAVVGAEVWLVR